MRTALLSVVMMLGGLLAEAAKAQTFCAVNNEGATNCAFLSIDRCRDEVRAGGGFCIPQAPVGHRQPRCRDEVRAGGVSCMPQAPIGHRQPPRP